MEVPNGHVELVFDKKADIRVYPRLVKEGISSADLKKGLSVKNEDKTVSGNVKPFFKYFMLITTQELIITAISS